MTKDVGQLSGEENTHKKEGGGCNNSRSLKAAIRVSPIKRLLSAQLLKSPGGGCSWGPGAHLLGNEAASGGEEQGEEEMVQRLLPLPSHLHNATLLPPRPEMGKPGIRRSCIQMAGGKPSNATSLP